MDWGSTANYPLPQTVNAFYIGETEITYELWYTIKTWAAGNGYTFANPGREGKGGLEGAAPTPAKNEPVTSISWRDAVVWCNAYSETGGKDPVYKNSGMVLRTTLDADSADIGSTANSRGLYDMSGNVGEWCQDMDSGSSRVYRGGSWNTYAVNCEVANRVSAFPGLIANTVGLRVACSQ
jgi:formylglycine-generating enzyme required for sulfatase activity